MNVFGWIYSSMKAALFVSAVVVLAPNPAIAKTQKEEKIDTSQTISHMILTMTLVATWPEAVHGQDGRISLCATHETALIRDLSAIISASRAASQYRFISNITRDTLLQCHVLIMDNYDLENNDLLWDRLKNQPILTVGTPKQFIQKGGMIGFLSTDINSGVFAKKSIRFEINLKQVHMSGLKIDPVLLELAERIEME